MQTHQVQHLVPHDNIIEADGADFLLARVRVPGQQGELLPVQACAAGNWEMLQMGVGGWGFARGKMGLDLAGWARVGTCGCWGTQMTCVRACGEEAGRVAPGLY